MRDAGGVAGRLQPLLTRVLGTAFPLRIRGWDGTEEGPPGAPVLVLHHRRALRRLLWHPGEMGLSRAYVAGELDVEGDLFKALESMMRVLPVGGGPGIDLTRDDKKELLRVAVLLGAVGPEPKPPPEEARLSGEVHSKSRDTTAIRYHYDVGNDFYRYVLGPTMVYSCAYWSRPDDPSYGLDDAQTDKDELVARKLGLTSGSRLLDVGCGWGTMVLHAAEHYGVEATGVTLSEEQAEYARKRVHEAGLEDRVDIQVRDYRDVTGGPYDAISSIGMAEHVGSERYAEYAAALYRLLRPGGRLLNHQIARRPADGTTSPSMFIRNYVFPDGELLPVGQTVELLEEAGFEVRDVESLREHYARTLRQWVANLRERWDACVALSSPGRARTWQLFMVGSALSFEAGRIGLNQVLAVRPHSDGRSDMPMTRTAWLNTH